MIKLLFTVVIICLNICVFANTNPCTDEDILSDIAITCASTQLINLVSQPTTELKCNIVMHTILPCILTSVNSTYDATCTAKEQHDVIMTFRETIKQYIGFDVIDCIPTRSCSTVKSMLYYLPVYCNSDYQSFVATGDCSKLRDALSCLRLNFNTTANETCTDRAVYETTVYNMRDWPHNICPACEPLEGYYCGLGPVVQKCPTDYYCNIHPADGFAVCCPKDLDSTVAPTTTPITPVATTGIPTMSCSNVTSLLYYLPMYCNSEYQSFVSTGNCSKFLDALSCFRNIYNTTENDTCTDRDVYRTVVGQMQYWPSDICPACVPLDGYFCGRGLNRRDCPYGYYCNIHPADGFAVCCPEDPDMTSTTRTPVTTYKDTSFATSIYISIPTVLAFLTITQFVLAAIKY